MGQFAHCPWSIVHIVLLFHTLLVYSQKGYCENNIHIVTNKNIYCIEATYNYLIFHTLFQSKFLLKMYAGTASIEENVSVNPTIVFVLPLQHHIPSLRVYRLMVYGLR